MILKILFKLNRHRGKNEILCTRYLVYQFSYITTLFRDFYLQNFVRTE